MKFKDLGNRILKRNESENYLPQIASSTDQQNYKRYIKQNSPILSLEQANYLATMRKQIKNNFIDKLSIMKNETTLYNYEENDKTLKAKSYLYNIPSLTSPQVAYQIAEKIGQQNQIIKSEIEKGNCFLPSSNHNHSKYGEKFSKVEQKFRYRNNLIEVQNWLKKKLVHPPITEKDSLEYKNTIMSLGMKEIIRILKIRCDQQGRLVEQIWQLTWKICQDIILFLSKELKNSKSNFDNEINNIEQLYVKKLNEINNDTKNLVEKIKLLEKEKADGQLEFRSLNRANKQLKMNIASQKQNSEHFQQQYMKILQENLALQIGNIDKRDWIKKLYNSVKDYKLRIAKKMKVKIKAVALQNSNQNQEQLLQIEQFEGNSLNTTIPLTKNISAQNELFHQFEPKHVHTQTQFPKITQETQTEVKSYVSVKICTNTCEYSQVNIQTQQNYRSMRSMMNELQKLKQEVKQKKLLNINNTNNHGNNSNNSSNSTLPIKVEKSKRRSIMNEEIKEMKPPKKEKQKKSTHNHQSSLDLNLPQINQISSKHQNHERNNNKQPPQNGDPEIKFHTESSDDSINKVWNTPYEKYIQSIDTFPVFQEPSVNKKDKSNKQNQISNNNTSHVSYETIQLLSLRHNKDFFIKEVETLNQNEMFEKSYENMKKIMKSDKASFQRSVMQRRSLIKPNILAQVQKIQDYVDYNEIIMTKLKKYNFNFLNKIKNVKNEVIIYKQMLKNLVTTPLLGEKKMEVLIEKNLLPVLIQILKYYKKLRIANKQYQITQFHKNLLPFPIVVVKKFTQKYGVKNLALKHLKQILSYVTCLRTKSMRNQIIYKLMFAQSNWICSDDLILYMNMMTTFDPLFSGLSSNTENYKILEEQDLQLEMFKESISPYISINQFKDLNITLPININDLNYIVFQKFNENKNKILSNIEFLYEMLSFGNLLKIQKLSQFVLSLNFPYDTELYILKQIIYHCDIRTIYTKYQISKQRFISFLLKIKELQYDSIMKRIQIYNPLYLPEISQQNLKILMKCPTSTLKLLKYLQYQIDANNQNMELMWKYTQYDMITRKMNDEIQDFLGDLNLLSYKQLTITSNKKELFEIRT